MATRKTIGIICIVCGLAVAAGTFADAPAVEYETAIGGYYLASGHGITTDGAGNAYVIGKFYEDQHTLDILVVKIGPGGSELWTSAIVGNGHDWATDIALDPAGDVLVTGWTDSEDFPTTPDALDDSLTGFRDAFLLRLSAADGSILYGTLLGGDYTDTGEGIAINAAGEIILTGATGSTNFPTTPDAYQDGPNFPEYFYTDAFVTKLNPSGTEILYSTYFGGLHDDEARHIGVDADGSIVIAGSTTSDDFPLVDPVQANPRSIFVSKLSPDGGELLFSTYFGGTDVDYLAGIALDAGGRVYLTGSTQSIDFPTTPGAYQENFVGEVSGCEVPFGGRYNCEDVFLSKLDTEGGGLVYGTFLAGTRVEMARGVALDGQGRALLTGYTGSPDFPPIGIDFGAEIFASRISADGSALDYSITVDSGSANAGGGVAVGEGGAAYVTGAINVPAEVYVAKIAAFESPSCEEGCLIGGVCYDAAAAHPSNVCRICDPARSASAWSDNDGVFCDDDKWCNGVDECTAGECSVHVGPPCAPGVICNEALDFCYDDEPEPGCGALPGWREESGGAGLSALLLAGALIAGRWTRRRSR